MKCHFCVGLVLLAGSFLRAQGPAPVQAEPPTLRTSSALVFVPTTVKHLNGEFIPALSANDFTLTDNGVKQKIISEVDATAGLAIAVVMQTGSGLQSTSRSTALLPRS